VVLAHLVHAGGICCELNEMRWSREPVAHFVAIGALLFGLKNFALGSPSPAFVGEGSPPAFISAARVAELRQDWLARTGRFPGARALEALIQAEIDDEVLTLEARRLGVHRNDPIVQRRLLRNMSFLDSESERSAEDLLDEAYALRMDETDLVVRRRLIQKMKLDVFAAARVVEPTQAELADYLQRHLGRFTQPARARLSHVFLSRDRRGASLDADAETLLARLLRDGVEVERARNLGDPFLFPRDLPPRSERELAKIFGPEFAARAATLPAGRWTGPIPSAYGLHLVWVHDRAPATISRLDAVRSEVREALLAERGELALRQVVRALRNRHSVRVERTGERGSGQG
jgi:parvulin-like peptidyl-prolyl isomerase